MRQFITSCLIRSVFLCFIYFPPGNFCQGQKTTNNKKRVLSNTKFVNACVRCVCVFSPQRKRRRKKKCEDVPNQHVSRLWTFLILYISRVSALMRKISNYYSLPYFSTRSLLSLLAAMRIIRGVFRLSSQQASKSGERSPGSNGFDLSFARFG